MTKKEIKTLVNEAIKPYKLCDVLFKYDLNWHHCFPIKANEKFFLGIEEDDFILDGYSIRRFKDMIKIKINNNKYSEIHMREGNIEKITIPNVDISDWKSIFTSLKEIGKNIIIEQESLQEDEADFYIGSIESIHSDFLYFNHFDADGIWEDEPYRIPYSTITSVTFGSRYVEVFSKYIPPTPKRR